MVTRWYGASKRFLAAHISPPVVVFYLVTEPVYQTRLNEIHLTILGSVNPGVIMNCYGSQGIIYIIAKLVVAK